MKHELIKVSLGPNHMANPAQSRNIAESATANNHLFNTLCLTSDWLVSHLASLCNNTITHIQQADKHLPC